jgi:hypothetical protein
MKKILENPKGLMLVLSGIEIPDVTEFVVLDYFKKFKIPEDLMELISKHMPAKVSLKAQTLNKFRVIINMWDSAILAEMGNPKPYKLSEFLSLAKCLINQQPITKKYQILSFGGNLNVFYVNILSGQKVPEPIGIRLGSDNKWEFIRIPYDSLMTYSVGTYVFSK